MMDINFRFPLHLGGGGNWISGSVDGDKFPISSPSNQRQKSEIEVYYRVQL